MVMVQGVGTATFPTLVAVTMTLPRNSPVVLSVPADVTIMSAWQKLASACTVGGSCSGVSACGFALDRQHKKHPQPALHTLREAVHLDFRAQHEHPISASMGVGRRRRNCLMNAYLCALGGRYQGDRPRPTR